MRKIVTVLVLAGACALALGSSAPGSLFTPKTAAASKEQCLVPNVVGTKLAAAKQAIATAKCQTGSIKGVYSNIVPKGIVLTQTPPGGTSLAKGGKIKLVVSKGKKKHGARAPAKLGPPQIQDAGACGSPPCYTAFTVDGANPNASLQLSLGSGTSGVTLQLKDSSNANPLTQYDVSSLLPNGNSSLIHIELNLGTTDPAVFATTGNVQSYSTGMSGSDHTATIEVKPSSSSWKFSGCMTSGCGDQTTKADVDFGSMVFGVMSDLSGSPADFATAMHGASVSTNAQAMSFPTFNSTTKAVSFQLASPHLKANGVDVNMGFFKFFVPDAMIVKMGISDPTTVSQGSFSMTNSNGGTVNFSVTHVSSPAAGAEIDSTSDFTYSAPTFTLTPAVTKHALTVSKAGTGSGTVTSSPSGIDCGSTCTHDFDDGTSVTLSASAGSNSKFSGWSGDCSGTGSCSLTMSAAKSVTATFDHKVSPPQPKCVVPNVVGKKLAAAKQAIAKAKCQTGSIKGAYSSSVKKGRVISQSRAAKKRLPKGTKINLVVSKGKKKR